MPEGPNRTTSVVANGETNGSAVCLIGKKVAGVYVPTITNGTVKLQASYDGETWFDVKNTTPATLEFAASTGGFFMDADYVARCCMGANYIRPVCGASQGAERTFVVTVADD